MNDTLKQIHDLLVALVDQLSQAIDATDDTNVAKQLLIEMDEVVHRINLIQNLLFKQSSARLDSYLKNIAAANDSLNKSIQSVRSVGDVISKTTALLKYVDEAIDLAKTLAAV